jgi:hypothetical protein
MLVFPSLEQGNMDEKDLAGAQAVEPEDHANQAGSVDATRGLNLGGLFGALLGAAGPDDEEGAAETPSTGLDGAALAGLLGGLLGGKTGNLDLESLVEQSGVSQSVIQAAIPLVLSALLGVGDRKAGDAANAKSVTLADLLGQAAQGKGVEAESIAATGLPQELSARTGLDIPKAISAILAILKALGIGSGKTSAKPKSKRKAKAKPKTKPKPSASAKPKKKPKASSGATGAKPKKKPKSAGSTAKPKPATGKAKAKRKRTSAKRAGSVDDAQSA